MKREHILAVRTASILARPTLKRNQLTPLLNVEPRDVVIGHREDLDKSNEGKGDRNFLQGIGYAVLISSKGVLAYRRKGTEGRLDGKVSVGFGGHTSISDIVPVYGTEEIDFVASVNKGMIRELQEELTFFVDGEPVVFNEDLLSFPKNIGCIVCDVTDVDLLHIGFVSVFTLDDSVTDVKLGDHGDAIFWIENPKGVELEDCEEWTKIVLSQYF